MKQLLLICTIFPFAATAQLQLAKIFSDNMMLQRDKPLVVWGKAAPGDTVTVSFANSKQHTIAQKDAVWKIILPPQKAQTIPHALTVQSRQQTISINNILIGDIWLCMGQSNMEFPMHREMYYKEAIKESSQPLIRLYNPTYAGKNIFNSPYSDSVVQLLNENDFYKGQWQSCDSNSFKTMSAVAYYFGKNISTQTGVPIGLINIAIGGAPLETFIDTDALLQDSRFNNKVKGDWLLNEALPVWIRERGKQNIGSLQNIPSDGNGKNHAYKPGFAFKAGILPLLNIPIKGILCYQGESNAQEMERVNEYGALSALLIKDYRKKWRQPALPFYYVQLSSIDTLKYNGALWPQFRDEQRKMLSLISNSGMAVCSDIGFKDDVHPANKKNVGERLSYWALNKIHNKTVISSGPLPQKASYKNGIVSVSFTYAGKGLKTSDGKILNGFSAAENIPLVATIQKNKVLIQLPAKPEFIYYGWKSFSDGNLTNSDLLPASTFKIKVE
jgi:sialate O-acetylesterase